MEFKVSVIIPVFNAERYLKKAVESAIHLQETGEVILIDDGSTDNSISICHQLTKEFFGVSFFRHPDNKNHGPAATRNLGIKSSKYPFIAFLDADDVYLPNRFIAAKNIFENNPDADGVYGCLKNIYENEATRDKHIKQLEEISTVTKELSPDKLFKELIFFGCGRICLPTITLKRKVFDNGYYFNENLRWSEDTELWYKLSVKYKLYGGDIKTPVVHRLVHENNSIHNIEKAALSRIKMYESFFKWAVRENLSFDTTNDAFNALYQFANIKNLPAFKFFIYNSFKYPRVFLNSFFYKKLYLMIFD